ncbi:tetratricopeptide repeat protein [Cesiribacter sp. SM1]|uniref:tetratricopeptide repeat protein n=1 Tax=Cesiribacter sp. SM1 TaxID=2861196 RepID=UPI001CD5AF7B|nr:tetratricopeptide repeat protein [Cesiribacter sp. SM1]
MKAVKNGLLCIFLCLLASYPCFSQKYTVRDQAEITYQAHITLTMYKDLLNVISYTDVTEAEVGELIKNSYSDPQTQIFFSDAAIIEDNVKPSNLRASHEQDKNVKDYLKYFDLMYAKSDEQTVEFSDLQASNLKYRDYLYIKVKYTSHFKGRHKEDTTAYSPTERLAEIRVERKDNQWKTYITSIVYYNPDSPLDSTESDVELDETVADDGTFSNRLKAINGSSNSLDERDKAAQISQYTFKQDSVFSLYMQKGQQAFEAGSFNEAVAAYTQAQQINPYDITPRIKINEVTRSILDSRNSIEEKFQEALMNGDRAKAAREYVKAKSFYQEALSIKPHESALKPRISDLEKVIQNKALLESKFNVGNYKEAIKDYNKAIQDNKGNPDYYYGRGKCYEKLSDTKEAIRDYSKAIELDGNFIEAIHSRAKLYEQGSQHYEAIGDYSLIISNPDYAAEFYPARARIRKIIGDFKGAVEDYDEAIKLSPELPLNYFEKGLIEVEQALIEPAIVSFSSAIERQEDYKDAHYHRGLAYIKVDDVHSAAADFNRARELGIDNSQQQKISSLAFVYFSEGDFNMKVANYGDALGGFMNAVLIYPGYGEAWLRKGDAHAMLEDYENAIINYSKSLALDTITNAYYKRGLAYQQLNDQQSAVKDFGRYIPIGSVIAAKKEKAAKSGNASQTNSASMVEESADALYSLGYAQLMTQHYTAAIESLDKAIKVKKSYPLALFARGSAQYALKKHKKAAKDIEESIKLGYQKPAVFYTLGQVHEAMGDAEEAAKSYSQAIRADAGFEAAYKQRAICYKNTKQYKLALDDINTVFSLNENLKADVSLLTNKGLIEMYQNNWAEADKFFDHALSLKEDDGWALYGKACVLVQQNKIQESLELYRKAFQSKQIEWSSIKNDPQIRIVNKDKGFKELVKASF